MTKRILAMFMVGFLVLMGPMAWVAYGYTPVPTAPTNLRQTGVSDTTVKLAWDYTGTVVISSFDIFRAPEGSYTWTKIGTVDASTLTIKDTGLTPGTTYCYVVTAVNGAGSSPYSSQCSATTTIPSLPPPPTAPPAAPTTMVCTTVSTTQINVHWTDNSSDETGFIVDRTFWNGTATVDDSIGRVFPANTQDISDTGLVGGREYEYRIRATNSAGNSSYLDGFAQTVVTAPGPITGFRAVVASGPVVNLSWDPVPNGIGFYIGRRTAGDPSSIFPGHSVINLTSTSCTDNSDLTPGTTYQYELMARNRVGDTRSSSVSVTIPAAGSSGVPAAPSNFTATLNSAGRIALHWQDNSSDEGGFRIYKKTNGSAYDYWYLELNNVQSDLDSEVTPGNTYQYRVQAVRGTTVSDWVYSNIVTVPAATTTTPPSTTPGTTPSGTPGTSSGGTAPSTGSTAGTKVIRFYVGSCEYYVNDVLYTMDTAPVIKDGRTLLPIKYVAEQVGATVGWDSGTRRASISTAADVIWMWIGRNTAQVNGVNVPIDPANSLVKPITVPPGRTLLPLRFVAEKLNCKLDWNPITKEIKLTYPKP
ncbi:MAG: stalk domain-containing protein [Acidobacteriota bacterium]